MLILIILLGILYQFSWRRSNWKDNVLAGDGRGYYSYLTNILIYQDPTFKENSQAIDKAFSTEYNHHYVVKTENEKYYNKTFPGTALFLTPLFIISYFLSFIFGLPIDGFNPIFLLGIQFSGILACVVGSWFFKKTLISLKISPSTAIASTLFIIFGSNIYYYATGLSSLSHIYSFLAFSGFLYSSIPYFNSGNKVQLISLSIWLGLIFLIRPTNTLIMILVPLIVVLNTGSIQPLWNKRKDLLFYALPTTLLIISILPIVWFAQTNEVFLWSYGNEGFYWLDPKPFKVLFSYQNGTYIYAPLALIAWIGFIPIFRISKWWSLFALAYFTINLYIISAWWIPTYSGGFGHRAMSEHFIFSGILLAFLLQALKSSKRKLVVSAFTSLSLLSVFQGYQINKGILPSNYINSRIYWSAFLKGSNSYINKFQPIHDTQPYGKVVESFKADYLINLTTFDEQKEFGPQTTIDLAGIYSESSRLFFKAYYEKKLLDKSNLDSAYLNIDAVDVNHEILASKKIHLYEIRNEGLSEFVPIDIQTNLDFEEPTSLRIYIWNEGKHKFQVKNMIFELLIIE